MMLAKLKMKVDKKHNIEEKYKKIKITCIEIATVWKLVDNRKPMIYITAILWWWNERDM